MLLLLWCGRGGLDMQLQSACSFPLLQWFRDIVLFVDFRRQACSGTDTCLASMLTVMQRESLVLIRVLAFARSSGAIL